MNLKTFKIIDYRIISDSDAAAVENSIRDLINLDDGWQPHGLMLTNVVYESTIVFSQVMAKYVPELWPED